MSRTVSAGTGESYGLARVSRVWGMARSSVYYRKAGIYRLQRPGPEGLCPEPILAEEIQRVIRGSSFHGEGYRKVWAKLRFFEGIRTSKRRALRLMREKGLLAVHRVGHPHGPRAHDGKIISRRIDEMWGTDMPRGSFGR